MNRLLKTAVLGAIALGVTAIAPIPASASGWASRVEGRRHTYDRPYGYGHGYDYGYRGYVEGAPYQGYGIPSYGYEDSAAGPYGYGYEAY